MTRTSKNTTDRKAVPSPRSALDDPESQFEICDKRAAILAGSGHMLILGGPGSGKTTIGLLKARRVALEYLEPAQSVLFVSFSNAAIRRILESGRRILSRDVERRIEIKTYHSFAWEILRSHGYLLSSRRRLTVVGAQDAAVLRAGMKEPDWRAEEKRLFLEDGRVTYDQFAPRAAELLERSCVVRKCFNHAHPLVLVDEFQDTDEDQWRLIRALAGDSEIVALGDAEQRIYAWRRGVSATRLQEFASTLDARVFDFHEENKRSPATGIAGYARSLLSPGAQVDLPDEILTRHFLPGRLATGLRFALRETWKNAAQSVPTGAPSIAVAARSRTMVRRVSDALSSPVTIRKKQYIPIPHDVMCDQTQIALAARVIAFLLASRHLSRRETISGTLERIGAVQRASGTKTAISASDRLSKWAEKVRSGTRPNTKCVNSLDCVLSEIRNSGLVGSPTEDWLTVRQALERAEAKEVRQTGEHARYLRLLRRGSAIEEELASLWRRRGNYEGAEAALDEAILQNQLRDNHRTSSLLTVMTMHQLKAREYDAVLLVEDRHRTFRGRDGVPPYMETRRLLQVSLTRARHVVCILSEKDNATLDVILTS